MYQGLKGKLEEGRRKDSLEVKGAEHTEQVDA